MNVFLVLCFKLDIGDLINEKYIVLICKKNKNITFYFYVLSSIRFLVPETCFMLTQSERIYAVNEYRIQPKNRKTFPML